MCKSVSIGCHAKITGILYIVIYNKKYIFNLCSTNGTEFGKSLKFPVMGAIKVSFVILMLNFGKLFKSLQGGGWPQGNNLCD